MHAIAQRLFKIRNPRLNGAVSLCEQLYVPFCSAQLRDRQDDGLQAIFRSVPNVLMVDDCPVSSRQGQHAGRVLSPFKRRS